MKAAVDWIEQEHKSAVVICITPDEQPAELISLAQSKGIPTALMAFDPRNRKDISTKNIYQMYMLAPDGSLSQSRPGKYKETLIAADTQKPGTFHIPVQGLTDAKVIAAWWMVERGTGKGALKELILMAKKKGPQQEQAQLVVDAAQQACDTAFAAAGDGFVAYETIERLMGRCDGLNLKPLKSKLGELGKDATVKAELKARDLWQKCQAALTSTKPAEQAAGRDGLAQLAKKMPATVYGKKAASK